MITYPDDLACIGDADQNDPARGIGKSADLTTDIRCAGALELNGEPFAEGEKVGEIFLCQSVISPSARHERVGG